MKTKRDPRNIAPRVADCLRKLGFEVREVVYDNATKAGREEGMRSVRALIAASSDSQPAAICVFGYLGFYTQTDVVTHELEGINIQFYDSKTGHLIFKTAKYNYDAPMPEDVELNRRFAKISDAFFPGRPNPFLTR